jgi:hypothetical protein
MKWLAFVMIVIGIAGTLWAVMRGDRDATADIGPLPLVVIIGVLSLLCAGIGGITLFVMMFKHL